MIIRRPFACGRVATGRHGDLPDIGCCGCYNGTGGGVGYAVALHGSPSGRANAPNTALQLTGCTAGDFAGYFCAASREGL
jgi:hypothetical protein